MLPIYFRAVIHIWTFMDRMKYFPQTCPGALCELRIKYQCEKLIIIISRSIVLGTNPDSLHGLRPVQHMHLPRTIQSLGESYHRIAQQTCCYNTWGFKKLQLALSIHTQKQMGKPEAYRLLLQILLSGIPKNYHNYVQ